VYVGDELGNAFALNPANGAILWQQHLGPFIFSSPAVDANNVVFLGVDEKMFALNGATGATIWSFSTGGDIRSSPAVGVHGTVYVGSDDDKLYAFGSPTVLGERWSESDDSSTWEFGGCAVGTLPAGGSSRTLPIILGLGALALSRRRFQRGKNTLG
jgi:outer membrane protein assembly factor BamB